MARVRKCACASHAIGAPAKGHRERRDRRGVLAEDRVKIGDVVRARHLNQVAIVWHVGERSAQTFWSHGDGAEDTSISDPDVYVMRLNREHRTITNAAIAAEALRRIG